MFIKGDLRKDMRKPFVTPLRYSANVLDMRELTQIHDIAVSVDIGTGGIGILTDYPLEEGHVLTFNDEITMNNITAKSAIVRWSGKVDSNKYRVGLKFV
jgi:hypothetical protein